MKSTNPAAQLAATQREAEAQQQLAERILSGTAQRLLVQPQRKPSVWEFVSRVFGR